MKLKEQALRALKDEWLGAWPEALAVWSRYTKLSEPRWCFTEKEEQREGLSDSFAMIRLSDQAVVISLRRAVESGVQSFLREILAHEIGHHVYVPANLLEHGRMLARVRRGLPGYESYAPMVANLYSDLLINDRLQRQAGLNIAGVYQAIEVSEPSPLWHLFMRTYEILWSLQRGTLTEVRDEASLEADAGLAARVIRSFAREWLDGAGRFAVLCLTYLLDEPADLSRFYRRLGGWCDTIHSGQGADDPPPGLVGIESGEAEGIIHPLYDPELSGVEVDGQSRDLTGAAPGVDPLGDAAGQSREPFEYGQILQALGIEMSDHDIAVQYYRELAAPHLVRFPSLPMPHAGEPLPEGLDIWDFGQSVEEVDWLESVIASPNIIPGVTTRQRLWGQVEGSRQAHRPVDLDLYVDCSGSMPNPQRTLSPIALAGAIVALSALRVGAGVQATLWSGARQFETTGGFVRNAVQVLQVLTGYIGGGTAFPLHILRDTYAERKPEDPVVHLLVISDDGVTTMFDRDERDRSGEEISAQALQQASGGGTMVLNLYGDWMRDPELRKAQAQGWEICPVRTLEELGPFARQFARRLYQLEKQDAI